MKLVLIDDTYVNPENVCRVGPADPNGEGFLTELVDESGKQLFRVPVVDVVAALTKVG
jgi:hypothetical protein